MAKNKKIEVLGNVVRIITIEKIEFISISDMASYKNLTAPKDVVKNWLRNRSSIEFLGIWEQLYNPNFKGVEFDSFLFEAGSNSFTLSPSKWIEDTNAIGLTVKRGRNGGIYAQKDIAFEFGSWLSAEFKLYLIKEFQRLKEDENDRLNQNWNLQRTLAKINYTIHTDAIKEKLIPNLLPSQKTRVYATEADMLNVALFGLTAKEYKTQNPNEKGNLRDHASLEQLVVLSNMESINAVLIRQGLSQSERLVQLNQIAINQMTSLLKNNAIKKLQ